MRCGDLGQCDHGLLRIIADFLAIDGRDAEAQDDHVLFGELHQLLRKHQGPALIGFRYRAAPTAPHAEGARLGAKRISAKPFGNILRIIVGRGAHDHLDAAVGFNLRGDFRPIDVLELRSALDDGEEANAIAGDVAEAIGDHRCAAEARELVQQEQQADLVLVTRGQLADIEVNELLEKQAIDRCHAIQIIRRDAEIERDPLVAELAQIEIADSRCRIDIGVQPQIDLGGDGLAG